ncbi:MAG: penicillin acylase family protein [Saprospirales bacterium]|nr:penicillin acylase family protein [Saprospirales bacterium]
MRYLKFFVSALLTTGLVWLLNTSNPLGLASLPPLGKLLSPFTGFWQNAEEAGVYPAEQIRLPGLSEPVKVVYDTRMVPHIFAQNTLDALRTQGYLTAKLRLWQMDMAARSGAGRLSEIIGERTVKQDRFQRRRGLARGAGATLKAWENTPDTMAMLMAYTEGINAYIQELKPKDYPIEFKLLDYAPELWNPFKTALVLKLNTALLCFKEEDVESSNTLTWLGSEVFDLLFPERPPHESVIVPDSLRIPDSLFNNPTPQVPSESLGYWHVPLMPKPPLDVGSNNWAVSGSKTSSGYPILCNDPHLPLSLPSLWMEIQIHTPEMNVYGVSLPGLPGVVLGFNDHIAWGWTNASHDVLDWYEVQWTGPDKSQYVFDGVERPVTHEVETIYVKGHKPVLDTITYTHWGPIVYEDQENPKRNLAMRWPAIEAPNASELGFLLGINAAHNYDDFQRASKGFHFPGQNMVFASREGDIAMTVTGRYPQKRAEQGRFIQPGNTSANFWEEYIPFDDLPRMKNPARGFVGSANQLSAGPAYPYYYNGNFNHYRGRYIDRKLAEQDKFSLYSMMDLQTSNYSIMAEEALPAMLNYLDKEQLSAIELGMVQLLSDWEYYFNPDEIAPILFDEWWTALDSVLWDEFYHARDTLAVLQPEKWETVHILQSDPRNTFWDIETTPERESAAQTVTVAFQKAIKKLRPILNEVHYDWGTHHAVHINHMALIPAFSSPPLRAGGYPEALNATRTSNGPSWRMVVEMGPEIRAYGVYPGGQSGNPGSFYYDNFLETWTQGLYYPLFFMESPEDRKQEVLFEGVFSEE